MKKRLLIAVALMVIIIASYKIWKQKKIDNWTFKDPRIYGCVPDAETATRIAEAVWLPIYGDQIYSYKPFVAELKDSIWNVKCDANTEFGGVIHIQIGMKDCKVYEVYHEK